jgi:hypothetical protein
VIHPGKKEKKIIYGTKFFSKQSWSLEEFLSIMHVMFSNPSFLTGRSTELQSQAQISSKDRTQFQYAWVTIFKVGYFVGTSGPGPGPDWLVVT